MNRPDRKDPGPDHEESSETAAARSSEKWRPPQSRVRGGERPGRDGEAGDAMTPNEDAQKDTGHHDA